MSEPNNTYKISRTCSSCNHLEELALTKREAAFQTVDINIELGYKCKVCSSTTFSTSYEFPDLDFELIREWTLDPNLHLLEQDEELLLADGRYLDSIIQLLDTPLMFDHKRNILMDALCIIVYDNSIIEDVHHDEALRLKVISELNKRIDKLKLADNWIMEYIKEVVYPQLDFGN